MMESKTTLAGTLMRAQAALDKGLAWRAREILSGALRGPEFRPKLHEAYGRLLLQLGDDFEAGRQLLWAGVEDSALEPPIELYLSRLRRHPRSALGTWPAAVRRAGWEAMSPVTRRRLVEIGVTERDWRHFQVREKVAGDESSWRVKLFGLVFVVVFIAGLITTVRWLIEFTAHLF